MSGLREVLARFVQCAAYDCQGRACPSCATETSDATDAVTAWMADRLSGALREFFRKTAEIEADAALAVVSRALGVEVDR